MYLLETIVCRGSFNADFTCILHITPSSHTCLVPIDFGLDWAIFGHLPNKTMRKGESMIKQAQ